LIFAQHNAIEGEKMSEWCMLQTDLAMCIGARIWVDIRGEHDPCFSFGLPIEQEKVALRATEAGLKFRLKELTIEGK